MTNNEFFTKDNIEIALKDDKSRTLTYSELYDFCDGFKSSFRLKKRDFILVLCDNTVSCVAFIIACIRNEIVPLLLNSTISNDMIKQYVSLYQPGYIFKPMKKELDHEGASISNYFDHELIKHGNTEVPLYKELSLLLPTSGTTGHPKLVRHSYHNLSISAENVAKALEISKSEHAILSLPIHFTQGLSVLCSHLYVGAQVFLTEHSLNSRDFWNTMKQEEITSFSGVPYSYEVLDRFRFYTMELPSLKVINQGGGRMTDTLFSKLSSYAANTGRKFYATYGATETTSRMSCLGYKHAVEKCGSIGKPLSDYEMWLIDDNNEEIATPDTIGELVFKGGNVTLGYAESASDLSKGDEWGGVYKTGDLAYRDKDGFYYITGRLSRFIKIFGYRINLDEVERVVKSEFNDSFVCAGKDEKLYVFTSDKNADLNGVMVFLKNKLKINISAFEAVCVDEIPKKQNNKTDYEQLSKLYIQRSEEEK